MRNYFSLYCLNMEAQVVNTNMNQFAVIMQEMVDTQLRMNEQVGRCLVCQAGRHTGRPDR